MSNTSVLYQICAVNVTADFVCTPETCCLEQGEIKYIPTIAGNSIYAAIFGLILLSSLVIGIRYRTTSFTTWLTIGLVGEIVGYIGRIMLHNNIFSFNAFLTYLIPLTISPAFLTACIYLCLARIIHIVDPHLAISRLKPRTYTTVFVISDFLCLVLQGAGGGIAATTHVAGDRLGVNIMIGGLALQVISIIVFILLCSDFAWRWHSTRGVRVLDGKYTSLAPSEQHLHKLNDVRRSRMFKGFVISLAVATFLILVRSIYRLAELQGGFDSKIANNEATFMIFEGPMIILSVLALSVFHPGFSLGRRELWNMKAFQGQISTAKSSPRMSEEETGMLPMVTVEQAR